MGTRSPAAAALLFPPRWAAALAQPPALASEQKQRWGLSRTGRGAQRFPLLTAVRLQEWERQPCSAGTLEGGHGPQSQFQYGHGILAPSQRWLEGDALVTGRGKVLWLVMPHGDQKGRCMPEKEWYCLSYLRTVVFKCLLVDDLLPTAGSVSPA